MIAALLAGVLATVCVVSSAHVRGLASVTRARRRVETGVVGSGDIPARSGLGPSLLGSVPRIPMPERVRHAVHATGVSWHPDDVVVCWIGLAVGLTVVGLHVGGPPTALIGSLVATAGGAAALWFARNRRRDLADRALPALLESVGRSLRSGASLTQSVLGARAAVEGTPLARDMALLSQSVERGSPLVAAFERWGEMADSRPRRLAASAMTLAAETGGAPGPLVDSVAQTLRDRECLEREARALSTQARSSAVVVAVAPLVFTAIASMADPHVGAFLCRTPLGLACLAGGLGFEGAGAWWMARLVSGRR